MKIFSYEYTEILNNGKYKKFVTGQRAIEDVHIEPRWANFMLIFEADGEDTEILRNEINTWLSESATGWWDIGRFFLSQSFKVTLEEESDLIMFRLRW